MALMLSGADLALGFDAMECPGTSKSSSIWLVASCWFCRRALIFGPVTPRKTQRRYIRIDATYFLVIWNDVEMSP